MDHHPKINLTLKDVKHLHSQFAKNSIEKINLYLPTTDSDDFLKTRVIQLINDFIYEILEDAKHSLDIDGVGPKDKLRALLENPTNETEPFDFSLQDQVRKLYQQVEDETIKLTKLRREKPLQLKRKYEESFETSIAKLQSLQNELEEEEETETEETDEAIKTKQDGFERNVKARLDEIIGTYESSLKDIKYIKDVIPSERGEIEKIDQIAKFLIDKK